MAKNSFSIFTGTNEETSRTSKILGLGLCVTLYKILKTESYFLFQSMLSFCFETRYFIIYKDIPTDINVQVEASKRKKSLHGTTFTN